jgi:diguanylate cyclase (GGDEF)-like protein
MMINFAIAMTTAVALVERLIRYYDVVVAGCAFLLVLVLNVAFPFAVQWLVHALASELRQSSRDALTGLLIRRAFYHSTYGLLLRRREGPSYLGVATIDLDNFKRLNDTHGHSTGDKALVAVAGALRLVCPPTTTIARFCGEEFVVARHLPHRRPARHRRTVAQSHRRHALPHHGQHRHRQRPAGRELRPRRA